MSNLTSFSHDLRHLNRVELFLSHVTNLSQ